MDATKVFWLLALTATVLSKGSEAIKCYKCSLGSTSCSTIVDCAADEICSFMKATISTGNLYKTGCQKKATCPQPIFVGRRSLFTNKRSSSNRTCCSQDYCNGPPGAVAPPTIPKPTQPTTNH